MFIKFTFRSLLKSKTYSIINISGLAVSLAASILLLLWVNDELSYNGFHKNINNLYTVASKFEPDGKEIIWGTTAAPLAYFAKKELPGVQDACRMCDKYNGSLYIYNNKKFIEPSAGLADASFFTMFSFPLVKGNPKQPFTDDLSVVISESTAKKMFGDADPLGKSFSADDKNVYHVTGVMKDIPSNSNIRCNMVFNFSLLERNYDGKGYWKSLDGDWGNYNYNTYLLLKPGTNAAAIGKKMADIHRKNQGGEFTKSLQYLVYPLSKLHLYGVDGKNNGMTIVRVFFLVAVIILLIACINYVNLVTARAAKRAKEISVRKIIGAGKATLLKQFLGESLVLFVMALVLATAAIYAVMPLYNDIAGKQIEFHFFSAQVLSVYGIALAATFILAGIYPAVSLSSFKPLQAIKGRMTGMGSKAAFRKVLVTVQFTCSIILIISTVIIGQQLHYIRQKNLGYDKENILTINMGSINDHYDAAKEELLKQPGILAVTAAGSDILNAGSSTGDADWDGKKQGESFIINQMSVERNFMDVLNLKLAAGKGFSGTPADSSNYILNETAIAAMGIKNPVGKRFTFHDTKGTIVGVVKDFHFKNMHNKIEPAILFYNPGWRWKMYVKTTAENASKAIAAVERVWQQYNPDYPFEYTFLDDSFDKLYKSDTRIGELFNCFAVITILISCLGLFGLVTYTAETKIKEIGVRKVLGAGVLQIVNMLSKEFLQLVLVAAIIAVPLAWYGINKFLEGYAYHTGISWWVFAAAICITLFIAIATISYQAIKAALANPVKSLRTE
ncbi:MAG TPA: ABC transporter permease [Chitinophagaceae bacterium]|nr:ABC transporter permease [Chitinophagaceae bacterium]